MSHWALALCFLLFCVTCAWAAVPEKSVTLTDYLGAGYTDELVHYALDFPPGAVPGTAAIHVQAEGGNAIPCQLTEVTRHADGSMHACTVWFLATVPANGTVTYTLSPAKQPLPDAGITVKTDGDTLTMTTSAPNPLGIRLLNGAKTFDPPQAAADVPGPIQGLLLPSGHVTGASRLSVPFKVKSYTAELTAAGPIFAETKIDYTFDTGSWTFTARVVKGCPTVIIHEEFNTGNSGQLARDADRFFTLPLSGKAFAPTQFFFTGHNDLPELATIVKDGMREDWKASGIAGGWFASAVQGGEIPHGQAQELYHLLGYPSGLPRIGCMARVQEAHGDAVGITGLDTTYWREPLSIRLRSTATGEASLCFPLQAYRQEWATEGFGHGSPNYTGVTLGVPENTARRAYGIMLSSAVDEKTEMLQSLFTQARRLDALPLDTVKDWTLDWPDPLKNAPWAAESSAKGKKALAIMRTRFNTTHVLAQWARFSMAYHYGFAKGDYPDVLAAIDSPADLSLADRTTLRRLCAWNAYDMNATSTFPFGMGFHLNNPNMSVMAVEARVKSSLLVKDHPLFKPWGVWSLNFLKDYNRRFTRESGALYENPHYSLGVTLDWQAQANKILMDAGIGDAFDAPQMPKAMRFMMNWLTPPDPRFLGYRMVLPIGNCSYQSIPPTMATQFVSYYKDRNPELAGQFQWCANQTLPPKEKLALTTDIVPSLGSAYFRDYGVFFRHGFGTPYETLFFLLAGNCDGHCEWEQDQMSYTMYAKGQPINLHFGNGYFPMFCRPWLRNRVSIDHMYEESERNVTQVKATAFTPEVEYAHATRDIDSIRPLKTEYPVLKGLSWAPEENLSWPTVPEYQHIPMTVWHRQVLFLKDVDPQGPNYFVLRDTFDGTPSRPTDLSLWFLANTMTRNGDTYHFDGQCKVDMDVFVASPTGTDPETGKYGHVQQPYRREVGFDPKYHPDGKLQETQLFLRLKQPVGKGYLVVLYPRLKDIDPPAAYTALADGVVRIETPLSTDYTVLNQSPVTFKDKQVRFQLSSGAVRFYKSGNIAVINTEGKAEITVHGKTISGIDAFQVTLENGKVNVSPAGAKVTVK